MPDPRCPADTLDGILASIWSELTLAVADDTHAFRIAGVATIADGVPAVRRVVLRAARLPSRELEFHTDRRSPKIAQLAARPVAEWLFYDPASQVQVRAMTAMRVHAGDGIAIDAWAVIPPEVRARYAAAHAPGTPVPSWVEGVECRGSAAENFAVVIGAVMRFDFTRLRPEGNQRARFTWDLKAGRYVATWVAP
jgi:hypothetical protein